MDKTFVPKGKQQSEWLLVDANEQNLGRMATQIAAILLGKNKPTFTPGVEIGDSVIVINAARLSVTQKRLLSEFYYRHSNYPGGLTKTSMRDQMLVHPDRVIRAAVWGMLPHNKLGRRLIKKLRIYAGNEHEQQAQTPRKVE
ncbi:MAG TPA: 50S ribosomal protein L13 [Anaerolineaceae bacterium]|nr:50S ribosomal protein L13 [Anaerolineaceae bacterium]